VFVVGLTPRGMEMNTDIVSLETKVNLWFHATEVTLLLWIVIYLYSHQGKAAVTPASH